LDDSTDISCYRCGASLAELSLPISRRDECPDCSVYLHVCRMCRFFDAGVPRKCTEDDAEEVIEKERVNFCEWFKPAVLTFDPSQAAEESRAHNELAALFGDGDEVGPDENSAVQDAKDLFK
jgi:hypothetical protein